MELKRQVFTPQGKVKKIDVKFIVEDAEVTIYLTDVMLQGGTVATMWTGHPSEIKWSFDG
ncbi:hypothetical protein TthWC1_1567 [Thermoanaerobacter thermohydrosulfuricus WC1]|uniref:Uncharacterized protein n=2 Tax=Thermoanaerobacter TaxID=1754 RepID=D3T331_THEIA|nr:MULTISPECIES: hypothetical protein [Thermoanaerobacter]ADD02633.1 conserved hypothetical protein [Thermoanaerobacter italicus Ab9]EMT38889.1 hypothetical protein TthWC1_1567 [Thermoanaerobacter thermohydrosulfuricus WC1]